MKKKINVHFRWTLRPNNTNNNINIKNYQIQKKYFPMHNIQTIQKKKVAFANLML
jgi:hypothetical protein